jgi:hypothetical protein
VVNADNLPPWLESWRGQRHALGQRVSRQGHDFSSERCRQIEDTIRELTNGKQACEFEVYFSKVFPQGANSTCASQIRRMVLSLMGQRGLISAGISSLPAISLRVMSILPNEP